MKRGGLPLYLFLTAGLFAAQVGLAAQALPLEKGASRPATKKDLVGTWEMTVVRPVHDAKDPAFYPYQRYLFRGDSSMKFMASDKPFTKEWLDKFHRQAAEIDYRVDERGLLSLMWQKQSHRESAVCAYVLKDIPADVVAKLPVERRKGLPKKGDITLSFLNSAHKIVYQKVLKRVE